MSKLSGIRDVDREIMDKVDDRELLNACSINKYTWSIVCDDAFLRRRLLNKYPEIEQYKGNEETWKRFFSRSIHYITLLKDKYDYIYTFGNFIVQYNIFKREIKRRSSSTKNSLLVNAADSGELALVMWCLETGADIHYDNDLALRWTSNNGHLEVVKYLIKNGAHFVALDYGSLRWACINGHLEVVKYLVKVGFGERNIHYNHFQNDVIDVIQTGHLEILNYLVERGGDIYPHLFEDASRQGWIFKEGKFWKK